jgi:hypothetical protein
MYRTYLYCGSELDPGLIVSLYLDSEIGSASRFGKEKKMVCVGYRKIYCEYFSLVLLLKGGNNRFDLKDLK